MVDFPAARRLRKNPIPIMKTQLIFLSTISLILATVALADEPPVPFVSASPAPAVSPAPDHQQLYGGPAPLVTPEAAKALVDKFRSAFAQSDSPRFVFYVNRELIDVESG
jgi:hypothetical protein